MLLISIVISLLGLFSVAKGTDNEHNTEPEQAMGNAEPFQITPERFASLLEADRLGVQRDKSEIFRFEGAVAEVIADYYRQLPKRWGWLSDKRQNFDRIFSEHFSVPCNILISSRTSKNLARLDRIKREMNEVQIDNILKLCSRLLEPRNEEIIYMRFEKEYT